MKLSEPQFFAFIARFVDAVVTEPLSVELRQTRHQRAMKLAAFEFESGPRALAKPAPVAASLDNVQTARAA